MKEKIIESGLKILLLTIVSAGAAFAQNPLDGRLWRAVEIDGRKVAGADVTLSIDGPAGRVAGRGGCNRFSGTARIDGRRIAFGALAATKMFCGGAGVMKRESAYFRALRRATRWRADGGRLTLLAGSEAVARFVRAAASKPDESTGGRLENRRWTLEKIGETPVGRLETPAFIKFDAEQGSAGGNTGCNAFGSRYRTDGEKIAFTDIFSTLRACIEDSRMDVERGFKNGLENAERWLVEDGRLVLYRGRTRLLTFRAEAE